MKKGQFYTNEHGDHGQLTKIITNKHNYGNC